MKHFISKTSLPNISGFSGSNVAFKHSDEFESGRLSEKTPKLKNCPRCDRQAFFGEHISARKFFVMVYCSRCLLQTPWFFPTIKKIGNVDLRAVAEIEAAKFWNEINEDF